MRDSPDPALTACLGPGLRPPCCLVAHSSCNAHQYPPAPSELVDTACTVVHDESHRHGVTTGRAARVADESGALVVDLVALSFRLF